MLSLPDYQILYSDHERLYLIYLIIESHINVQHETLVTVNNHALYY